MLVVEGATLYYVLDTVWSRAFLTLAESTKSVICCRVTPLQKALVVQLVKSNLNRVRGRARAPRPHTRERSCEQNGSSSRHAFLPSPPSGPRGLGRFV